MKTYNHMYLLAFTVKGSVHPEGEDVTADHLRESLTYRMNDLDSEGDLAWLEAVGGPDDSVEEEPAMPQNENSERPFRPGDRVFMLYTYLPVIASLENDRHRSILESQHGEEVIYLSACKDTGPGPRVGLTLEELDQFYDEDIKSDRLYRLKPHYMAQCNAWSEFLDNSKKEYEEYLRLKNIFGG